MLKLLWNSCECWVGCETILYDWGPREWREWIWGWWVQQHGLSKNCIYSWSLGLRHHIEPSKRELEARETGEKLWVKIHWGSIWHCRQIVEHVEVSLCSLIYFGLSVINLYNRAATFTSHVIDVILSSNPYSYNTYLHVHTYSLSFSSFLSSFSQESYKYFLERESPEFFMLFYLQ